MQKFAEPAEKWASKSVINFLIYKKKSMNYNYVPWRIPDFWLNVILSLEFVADMSWTIYIFSPPIVCYKREGMKKVPNLRGRGLSGVPNLRGRGLWGGARGGGESPPRLTKKKWNFILKLFKSSMLFPCLLHFNMWIKHISFKTNPLVRLSKMVLLL